MNDVRRVLPWETTKLISIVQKYDSCMVMPIRELAKEADYWKCRGRLKAQEKHRRYLVDAIIKKWVKFCFERYVLSAKQGHVERPNAIEHNAYLNEIKARGIRLERFDR